MQMIAPFPYVSNSASASFLRVLYILRFRLVVSLIFQVSDAQIIKLIYGIQQAYIIVMAKHSDADSGEF